MLDSGQDVIPYEVPCSNIHEFRVTPDRRLVEDLAAAEERGSTIPGHRPPSAVGVPSLMLAHQA